MLLPKNLIFYNHQLTGFRKTRISKIELLLLLKISVYTYYKTYY